MPSPAERLEKLPAYAFAVIGERIRNMTLQGIDVYRLDIGSPDLPPADFVVNALAESARNPKHHGYSGYRGTSGFREAVARYYKHRFGVTIDPETEVLPLIGSKEGIVNLALAYLDRGDIALVPDVGYPSYSMGAQLAGAEVHWMPMRAENGFQADFSNIPADIRSRAKLMWLNYPNNPTGATVDIAYYTLAVEFCAENDILLASDNPYVDLTFEDYKAPSALEAPNAKNQTVEFMSLSKTFNMAGWRLGAAVGATEALKNLLNVKSNMDSGHFRAIYDAGIRALDETTSEWLVERNKTYQNRRDKILEALPQLGLKAQKPMASLYVWAQVEKGDGAAYAEAALSKAHVSIAPGSVYGPGGENYVRISLSIDDQRLDEALDRMKSWYVNT